MIDSILDTYSPVDTDDPYFADSTDTRLYRSIDIVAESDESKKGALVSIKDLYQVEVRTEQERLATGKLLIGR